MKKFDVIVVGEIYVDHVFSGFESWPGPGEEIFTELYAREVGGGAVTTSCSLARLGRQVGLVGVVGCADDGWLRQRLDEFGLDTRNFLAKEGTTGVTVSISTREDRTLFTHIGVNKQLQEMLSSPEITAELAAARHIHFAMPLRKAQAATLLPTLRAAGCTVSLDIGFQPQWLTDPANRATCNAVDYLLLNEKEAALFCGEPSANAFFSRAKELKLNVRVLKLGARGAMGDIDDNLYHVLPPPVHAVDTTGAGDAFDAGFIDGWLDNEDIKTCLRRACICGALSTRAEGALAALPHNEVLRDVYEHTYGT